MAPSQKTLNIRLKYEGLDLVIASCGKSEKIATFTSEKAKEVFSLFVMKVLAGQSRF